MVHLLLILEVLLKLTTKKGNVTAAFLYTDLNEEKKVYIKMPVSFKKEGKVLKLKKTIYDLKQSP